MNIGQRLKEERERLKLSQTAFGEIGSMGKTTVIAWERSTAFPNAAFLELAANFGVDIYYVITGNRLENTATTPNELAYLRACRKMPNETARTAGREALIGILTSHGISMTDESYAPNISITQSKFNVHGNVGQQIENINGGSVNLTMNTGNKDG